jgi:succinate-semialdehyde dehydrogenase/glutarate-semialdehyde dehydrogenase
LPSRRSGPVVAAMLNDPRARVVSFTGSTEVGRRLLHTAADNVINPRMELGGNAPFIVFDDADLELAVAGALQAKMRNLGEACTAANRFYIQAGIYDAFVDRFGAAMAALKMGNGLADGITVGALVNAETRDKVEALVEDARTRGAQVVVGGKRADGVGYFYPPTVLSHVPDDALCLREEIFGPVAALQRFDSEDEVVTRANDTEYGLVAYVFTADMKKGLRLCDRLEFGMVGLNRGLISDPAAPFGGVKQSGLGREGAHEGLQEFQETQYISVEW